MSIDSISRDEIRERIFHEFWERMHPMEREVCEFLGDRNLIRGLCDRYEEIAMIALKSRYPDVSYLELVDGIHDAIIECGKLIVSGKFQDKSGDLGKSIENFICQVANWRTISILRKKDRRIKTISSDEHPNLRGIQGSESSPDRVYTSLYYALMEHFEESVIHKEMVNITCYYARFVSVSTYRKEISERLGMNLASVTVEKALRTLRHTIKQLLED